MSRWRKILKRFHPEGIPWPFSNLYNLLSKSDIFQQHYEMIAKDVARFGPPESVLDVGTGPGWLLLRLRERLPRARIVGADISEAMVEKAKSNMSKSGHGEDIEILLADAERLPSDNETFDTIISTGSLHHWKHQVEGLNEAYRVLKPGGTALIYDLVQRVPSDIKRKMRERFGTFRTVLLWLHSFEEPFLSTEQMVKLAEESQFGSGQTRFVGGLCCLEMKK